MRIAKVSIRESSLSFLVYQLIIWNVEFLLFVSKILKIEVVKITCLKLKKEKSLFELSSRVK